MIIKKYTRLLLVTIISIIPVITPVYALAQTVTPLSSPTIVTTGATATGGANQTQRIANLKARADGEIDRRVLALQRLITRLSEAKKLSDAQKSSFTSQIQSQITSLNSLKTKIDSDTDLATLKTDVQSIITSYRIFALYMPKIHILAAADRMNETFDYLSQLVTKLQDRITKAQAKGIDVTALNTALGDMQAKLADAKTQYTNAQNTANALTPEGYPDNKSALQSAKNMLLTARKDLTAARNDARTIIQTLKTIKENNPSTTLTPSITTSLVKPT